MTSPLGFAARVSAAVIGSLSMVVGGVGCTGSSPAVGAQVARAELFLPGHSEPQLVSFTIDGSGEAVLGGDIRLGPADELASAYGPPSASSRYTNVHSAVMVSAEKYLWPGGVMPYEIDASVGEKLRREILAAAQELSQRTRLTVRPRTPADTDYMVFNTQNSSGVCDSFLGRKGGPQPVRVNGCARVTIMHEILHAAGFDHEHQRADRDQFVTILWENVDPAHRTSLERVDERRTNLTAYDFQSIMHYQARAFSRNGKPTIVSRVPGMDVRGVQGLSSMDIQAIDRAYAGEGPGDLGAPFGFPFPLPFPTPGLPGPGTPSQLPQSVPSPFPGAVNLPLPNLPLPNLPLSWPSR